MYLYLSIYLLFYTISPHVKGDFEVFNSTTVAFYFAGTDLAYGTYD